MTDDAAPGYIEDPPNPDLADLQQRELPVPAVPVRHEGPVRTHALPSRAGLATTVPLPAGPGAGVKGLSVRVLDSDPRRARAILTAPLGWFYQHKMSGEKVPFPANTSMVLLHCDQVYACVADTTTTLSVITEYYAD